MQMHWRAASAGIHALRAARSRLLGSWTTQREGCALMHCVIDGRSAIIGTRWINACAYMLGKAHACHAWPGAMPIGTHVFRMRGTGFGREMNGSQCDDLCERDTHSEVRVRDGRWRRAMPTGLRSMRRGPETSRGRGGAAIPVALRYLAGRGGQEERRAARPDEGLEFEREGSCTSGLDRRNTFRDFASFGPGYNLDRCRLRWRLDYAS